MFHTCVLRFSGNPLTSSSPLGGGTLLPTAATDTFTWYSAAAELANAKLLVKPVSVQWVMFDAQDAAQRWVASADGQSVLATSFISGYFDDNSTLPLALLVHRWKAWTGTQPSMRCASCPPNTLSGGTQLPAFVGTPLNSLTASPPVETSLLHFADATALATYVGSTQGQAYLANTLCAQHLTS